MRFVNKFDWKQILPNIIHFQVFSGAYICVFVCEDPVQNSVLCRFHKF